MGSVLQGVRQGLIVLGLVRGGAADPGRPRRALVGLAVLVGSALAFGVLVLAGVDVAPAHVLLGAVVMGFVFVATYNRGRTRSRRPRADRRSQ